MTRILALLIGLTVLVGCARPDPMAVDEPMLDLGDFELGYNVVVAPKMQKGPISREATKEEWIDALTSAIDARLGRYDGGALYHLGISVEGYMLAPRGLPLVYTPKSALILLVTVWDDAEGRKLNDKPHQMIVFEDTEASSFLVGSGNSRDREEQLNGLAFNAAKMLEEWLAEQRAEYGWFTDDPVFNPPEKKPQTAAK